MQYDICIETDSQAALIAALKPLGLVAQDIDGQDILLTASHNHALAYVGRVIDTPAVIDAEMMTVTAEATYHPGEYAILRANRDLLESVAAVVEVVPLPAGCPTFGSWEPLPAANIAAEKEAACARIESKRRALEQTGVWINWPDGARSKIQTRDERDWRNINGVAARGLARLIQGSAEEDWFRDADDVNHTLLPPQAVDMGYQAASAVSDIAKVAHDAKDAINDESVTTIEQIAAIEAGVVWP